jgi:hypothetical protein
VARNSEQIERGIQSDAYIVIFRLTTEANQKMHKEQEISRGGGCFFPGAIISAGYHRQKSYRHDEDKVFLRIRQDVPNMALRLLQVP